MWLIWTSAPEATVKNESVKILLHLSDLQQQALCFHQAYKLMVYDILLAQ